MTPVQIASLLRIVDSLERALGQIREQPFHPRLSAAQHEIAFACGIADHLIRINSPPPPPMEDA